MNIGEIADLHYSTYQALYLYEQMKGDVSRIQDLVQHNPEFFGGVLAGESKMTVAADFLEKAIADWKGNGAVEPVRMQWR